MIHRSFIVPANAREAKFSAPVARFLGVIPGPGSFVICTLCDQPAEDLRPSNLVLPSGAPAPTWGRRGAPNQASDPEWLVQIRYEADEAPEVPLHFPTGDFPRNQARYLGSILTGLGPAAVYAMRVMNEEPEEGDRGSAT